MTVIEEIIKDLSPDAQSVAGIYMPVLTRWVAHAGWDAVRKSLYGKSAPSWYEAVRNRMTDDERDADDKRARAIVRLMAIDKAELIAKDRDLLQLIVTMLISGLLAKL